MKNDWYFCLGIAIYLTCCILWSIDATTSHKISIYHTWGSSKAKKMSTCLLHFFWLTLNYHSIHKEEWSILCVWSQANPRCYPRQQTEPDLKYSMWKLYGALAQGLKRNQQQQQQQQKQIDLLRISLILLVV